MGALSQCLPKSAQGACSCVVDAQPDKALTMTIKIKLHTPFTTNDLPLRRKNKLFINMGKTPKLMRGIKIKFS